MKKHYILLFTILISSLSFGQTVFINEIHYENPGADTNEGVEIAGPAGTDLSTYNITLYNGVDGSVYSTVALSGSIPDEGSGYGASWFAISGLQNGAPDGIALDNGGALIQFLSYEGSFTAVGGAANGQTSTDIGVSENTATESDLSLQLVSSGDTYGEFTWAGPVWGSFGSINPGQTFSVLNTPTLTMYEGPANGDNLIGDPETPQPGNTDITFITSHFTMSSDNGGGTGTGGDGFIKWSIENTNGNVPVDSGNFFTSNNPLIIQNVNGLATGQTYFFKAELVDNTGAPLSSPVVYSFTLTIATYTDVADLATLRTQTVDPDLYYRVTGQVINTFTNYDSTLIMFFQDGGTGIMVNDWDYVTQGYNTGDAISNIRGHLELANGVLQLVPSSADWGTPTTTGNTPAVSTVTIATLLSSWENYESELVRITNATFADAGNTFAFNTSYNITDASGTMAFTTPYSSLNYIGNTIPSGNQDLVVIVSEINGTPQVTSRNLADITLDSKSFEIESFKLYPNPTNLGYVRLLSKSKAKMNVSVFDVLGKTLISETITNNTLDVSSLNTGVYILKVSQDDASIAKRLLIK